MMKLLLRPPWSLWTLLLIWLPALYAQTGPPIKKIEIRHVGPPAASDALIKANIRVKVGDVYTRTGVDDDVRTLYSTGYFYNIRVATEPVEDGVNLVYVVQGKPVLSEISFAGNKKYSRAKLLKKITSKTGEPLDERKLFSDTQEIQKMYQKAGLQKTVVKYAPNIEEAAGRSKVTFEIAEAPKIKIDRVDFVGANAFSQKKLRKAIKTRRHWMFSWITGSGVLKDDQFAEDKEKLADFYRNEGYIDFEIKDVQFDQINPKRMAIPFIVEEGTQYKVGAVEINGNKLFSTEDIMKGFVLEGKVKKPEMTVGRTFTPKGLDQDLEAIRDFYGAKGYIDAWVKPIKNPNTEKGTMDLVYEIQDESKGQSFIEKIEIQGNTKTKDKVIRRELAVAPGEVFDMVRVKLSKGRLEQMNYFDKVETEVDPTDVPNRKNLVIDVEEGTTGHMELGAGFSSIDSLFGFVGYREGNFDLFHPPFFRGGGQKLRIGATIGLRRKDYQLTFVEPWFLNRKLAFGVDLYHSELNFLSDLYDIRQTGARLSLTKALGSEFLIGGVSYTMENIGIDNVDQANAPLTIRNEPRNRLVSKVGTSLAYDTRNSAQLPNRGQRTELMTEVAGGPLGADADFYKFELRSSWYFPGFLEGHVLETGGRAGVVESYDSATNVPLFDRYFLGGINSLRGYRYRKVGPHEAGEPIGGKTFYYGYVEYSVPIIERLR
ncbi:MAG: outer membrane protein assembly factor BamA, partial [Chloroflexi bacterium]|nr:outer membrane protein assembly factor BamA [Chloroflexota bacterium]